VHSATDLFWSYLRDLRFPRELLVATCGFSGFSSRDRVLVEGFEVEDERWRD